jgi:pimeloyl-ACP methyl ester carboxylesterase
MLLDGPADSQRKASRTQAGNVSSARAIHFGCAERPLFGFLHEPVGRDRRTGVVLCNPLGYEAICAHRAYRHLANHLASSGYSVLRFDYDGTGDSFGDDSDPGRVRAWLDSIHTAIDELALRMPIEEIVLFGLRLGGLLALRAAGERKDVERLILWAPCASGKAYLRELKALQQIHQETSMFPRVSRPGGEEEAAGFLISAETIRDLSALDSSRLGTCSKTRILLIARQELSSDLRLAARLESQGLNVETESLPGYPGVLVDPHKSELPDAVFASIERWLERRAAAPSALKPQPPLARSGIRRKRETQIIRERAWSAPRRALFGVLAEPAGRRRSKPSDAALEPGIVLLNPGAIHRIGMNRMYVTLARRWAALGRSVLRLDLSGIGDSPADPAVGENRLYSKHTVVDVSAALDRLTQSKLADRYILVGLCSGAYAAFHTALVDPRVTSVILINPQTFDYREGDSLDITRRQNFREARYYQRALWRPASWARALRGQVNFWYILRVLWARAREVVKARLAALRERLTSNTRTNPTYAAFAALAERGCSVHLIYSADDPGLEHFHCQVGGHKSKLWALPGFHCQVIDGPDHTFTPLWSQARLIAVLDRCLSLNPETCGQAQNARSWPVAAMASSRSVLNLDRKFGRSM